MVERIYEYLLEHARGVNEFARLLFTVVGVLMVFGAAGWVMTISPQGRPERFLADALPTLPTWFLPESVLGWTGCVMLMVCAIVLHLICRDTVKFMDRELGRNHRGW